MSFIFSPKKERKIVLNEHKQIFDFYYILKLEVDTENFSFL